MSRVRELLDERYKKALQECSSVHKEYAEKTFRDIACYDEEGNIINNRVLEDLCH